MQKICSNNRLRDVMVDQKEDSGNGNSQVAEKVYGTIVPMQKKQPRENSRIYIAGRPNINEISKRNEAMAIQGRKILYKVAGIIMLFIIAIIFLLYFFN